MPPVPLDCADKALYTYRVLYKYDCFLVPLLLVGGWMRPVYLPYCLLVANFNTHMGHGAPKFYSKNLGRVWQQRYDWEWKLSFILCTRGCTNWYVKFSEVASMGSAWECREWWVIFAMSVGRGWSICALYICLLLSYICLLCIWLSCLRK